MVEKNSACHPSAMMHGPRIYKLHRNRLDAVVAAETSIDADRRATSQFEAEAGASWVLLCPSRMISNELLAAPALPCGSTTR